MMLGYVDIFQVGARNMQNYYLLRALGEVRKPVLLKRGMSATMEELLLSAEYILAGGNYNVILCERGIRTFETYTRNTLDIAAIPVIKKLSHLPMLADPSHGTGRRDKVPPMARAAVAAGADGLLIEVHNDPDHALSDGARRAIPRASRLHPINGRAPHNRPSHRPPYGLTEFLVVSCKCLVPESGANSGTAIPGCALSLRTFAPSASLYPDSKGALSSFPLSTVNCRLSTRSCPRT